MSGDIEPKKPRVPHGQEITLVNERRKNEALRGKLLTLEVKKRTGKLLDRFDVEEAWSDLISQARSSLLSLPVKLPALLAVCKSAHEVKKVIEGAVVDILDDLSKPIPYRHAKEVNPVPHEDAAEQE